MLLLLLLRGLMKGCTAGVTLLGTSLRVIATQCRQLRTHRLGGTSACMLPVCCPYKAATLYKPSACPRAALMARTHLKGEFPTECPCTL